MRELEGRVAVFVGGGGNIGRAASLELARHGAHVVALDLDIDKAQETAELIRADGGSAQSGRVDAMDFDSIEGVLGEIVAQRERVDFFSYLVGWVRLRPSLEVPPDEFRRHLEVNLDGQFAWAQGVGRIMARQESGGSIALIGSVLGFGGIPRRAGYTASRGAIIQLVRTLAVEWAPLGIRVNAIAPGWIETEPLRQLGIPLDDYRQRTPMQRLGRPEDVAGPFRFLASDASGWVTGVTIPVDGGASAYLGPADPTTA